MGPEGMAWKLGEVRWETPAFWGSFLSTSMVVGKMLERGYPTFGGFIAFTPLPTQEFVPSNYFHVKQWEPGIKVRQMGWLQCLNMEPHGTFAQDMLHADRGSCDSAKGRFCEGTGAPK